MDAIPPGRSGTKGNFMDLIDQNALRQLAADLPPEDLRLVLQAFRGDVERLNAALEAAGQAGDAVAWRRAAHGLAGAASAVGAVGVEGLARQAMAHAAIEPAAAARALSDIRAAAKTTLAALRTLTDAGMTDR